jgi:hypothetical protein
MALSSFFEEQQQQAGLHSFPLMTAVWGSFLVLVCLTMFAASLWTTPCVEALLPLPPWVPKQPHRNKQQQPNHKQQPPQSRPSPLPEPSSSSSPRGVRPAVVRESFPFAWWDELAPPFAGGGGDNSDGDQEGETDGLSAPATSTIPHEGHRHDHNNDDDNNNNKPPSDVIHFCFLIHGYRGYARDLSYLQTVMERVVTSELCKRHSKSDNSTNGTSSTNSRPLLDESDDSSWQAASVSSSNGSSSSHAPSEDGRSDTEKGGLTAAAALANLRHDVILHTPICNERKTDDGVVSGGERLVAEIRQFIEKELAGRRRVATSNNHNNSSNDNRLPRITISLLGNSLGGLYARYALAKLSEECSLTTDAVTGQVRLTLDGQHRVDFNVFCTTATPHLGVASHTFLPIPRTAEISVARAMRSTGKDLFRCNDLLRRMATTAEFLHPLGSFRRRIAYANAYGTDFPVPVHTAAFLNEASASPHYFEETEEPRADENAATMEADADGLIIAQVYTPRRETDWGYSFAPSRAVAAGASRVDTISPRSFSGISTDTSNGETDGNDDEDDEEEDTVVWAHDMDETDELELMSQSLDTLGWRKVFVDARKNMPKIPLFGLSTRSSSNSSINLEDVSNHSSEGDNSVADDRQARSESIARLKSSKGLLIESKELALAVTAPLFDDNFHWPVGHNMIVAFSRSRLSTYLNKAGRPVVDSIARSIVQEILDWSPEDASTKL